MTLAPPAAGTETQAPTRRPIPWVATVLVASSLGLGLAEALAALFG